MKVLQVVPALSPRYGGPSVALVDLVRALRARGIEAELITTNNDPFGRLDVRSGARLEVRGAPVTYHDVTVSGRYAFSVPLARALRLKAREFDVLHVHWLYNFAPVAAAAAALRAGVPYVLQPNGSLHPELMRKNRWLKRAYLLTLGGFVLRNAGAILFTSEGERTQAALAGPSPKQIVIPVGLDWSEYAAPPAAGEFRKNNPRFEGKDLVLFVGRLSRQKGLDLLIPAFQQVLNRHSRAHLVIAGPDGEGYGAYLARLVAEQRLTDAVTFVGPLYGRAKLAAFVDSSVFVLPSYGENFGATVTEALACECPVVVSDQVNIWEELVSAGAGMVVRCTPESVADGVTTLLADQPSAREMGRRGRALVRERFTWDAALDALLPLYEELASSRRRAAPPGADA